MKRTVATVASLAALAIVTATSSAYALELSNEMYVVASVGQATVVQTPMQIDNNTIIINSASSIRNLQSTQASAKRGYKLQLGYEFTPNFAIEGGYVDLGKTTYSATYGAQITTTNPVFSWWPKGPQTTTTSTLAGSASREAKITGWNVSGVGIYPINDQFSVFGKLGMINAKVKSSDAGAAFASGDDTTETKWKTTYGVGGTYNFSKSLGVRAEFERFSKLGDSQTTGAVDVNLLSLGLAGRF